MNKNIFANKKLPKGNYTVETDNGNIAVFIDGEYFGSRGKYMPGEVATYKLKDLEKKEDTV